MKKIVLSLLMVFAVITGITQTVPREMVALEIATGTWCTYCPGAAMGADDLLENGCLVAVMENHNGDPFANQYSNARNTYYNVPGYPTAVFDGVSAVVGGNHSQSMYTSYLPKYQARIAVPTNIQMTMTVTHSGLDYAAVINMTKVGTFSGTNLRLRFSVTVSHIQYSWQGQNHLEHVNALMVPDAMGTVVDFSGGNTQTVTLNFSMDPQWPLEDCEFIAFLQTDANKEIFQTVKQGTIDLTPGFQASQTITPKNTTVTFTNETYGGYINTPEDYQWQFPGGTPSTSTDKDPTVTYNECGDHDVTLTVNRGGQTKTLVKNLYIHVGPVVSITALPNDTICNDETMILDATTANAVSYLWEPGGATTPTIEVSFPQYGLGSHVFTVHVTGADGCVTSKSITVFIDGCTGIENTNPFGINIYPNPNNGKFAVIVDAGQVINGDIRILNNLGMTVYEERGISFSGNAGRTFDLALPSGMYFMIIRDDQTRSVRKFFIR